MHFSINIKTSFYYLLLFILSVNESWSKHNTLCGNGHLVGPSGNISSPHYPILYHRAITCTWHILSPPQTTLKLHITDFDVPDDADCIHPPCCNNNWLSLPVNEEAGVYQQVCGNLSQPVITVSQSRTIITFHYSSVNNEFKRGFHLSYNIEKNISEKTNRCEDYQFLCRDLTCLQMSMKCDGVMHCSDGDDEMQCLGSQKCGIDEILCGPLSNQCFKRSELCDGIIQCPYGEDEYGCSPDCKHSIACQQSEGCYLPSQRCDGHSDCIDDSDESMCPDELCPVLPNKRQCRNGHCILARLWCDGSDDCGDFSDEEACLKNSMITIAIVGALLGGLFLVIAVGCSLRMYSRRYSNSHVYQMHLSPPGVASRLRMPHSLSLPALIDNEFFHREPPPVYSVAVANSGAPRRSRSSRIRVSRRSHHSHRHTVIPKPPSEEILNNSSSPSSEDSLVPAPSVTTSADDNEQLLTA